MTDAIAADVKPADEKPTDVRKRVERHLEAKETTQARSAIEPALVRWPENVALHLTNARLLEAEGRSADAMTALQAAVERFPAHAMPALALAQAARRAGLLDEARAALALARQRGLADDVGVDLELALARAAGDWPAILIATEKLVARQASPSPQLLFTLAQARARCKDAAGAEAAAQQVLAGDPRHTQAAILLGRLRLERNDAAGAEEAALRALSHDPTLLTAGRLAAQAAAEQGECDRTIAHYRVVGGLDPDDPRWPLRIVTALNASGRCEEAVGELAAVRERWPSHPVVVEFLHLTGLVDSPFDHRRQDDAADGAAPPAQTPGETPSTAAEWNSILWTGPREDQLARALVVDSPARDVLVAEHRGAETGVFVFTGLADQIGMPVSLFDRYLAALGVTAVYLKDFRRLLFMNGINSLGGTYEATFAALREMVDRLRIKHLCIIGNSGGGRPAIRYGVELGADRILAFDAATGSAPCSVGSHPAVNAIVSRRTRASVTDDRLDLKPFLASRRYASTIELYYGNESEAEKADALYLQGLPGVSLHAVAAPRNHSVLSALANQEDFLQHLATMLGLPIPANTIG